MTITISGYTWAKRHKREFDAIISIEDPVCRRKLRFHKEPHPAHLVLPFVDLDTPVPPPFDTSIEFRMASRTQIVDALAFAEGHSNILIHCQVGIARSTALALGVLMQRLGDEDAAFLELERIRPEAIPNRHVLHLVDDVLGCDLSSRLAAWDARNRWSQLRRLLCRKAYFLDGGLPLEPELREVSSLFFAMSQFRPRKTD